MASGMVDIAHYIVIASSLLEQNFSTFLMVRSRSCRHIRKDRPPRDQGFEDAEETSSEGREKEMFAPPCLSYDQVGKSAIYPIGGTFPCPASSLDPLLAPL